MAARALSHLLRPNPSVSRRCTVLPVLCRLDGINGHRRPGDRREDGSRYERAQALVRQSRGIHVTPRNESSVLLAGVGVAASAMVARYGILEYRKYQAAQPEAQAEPGTDGTEKGAERQTGAKATPTGNEKASASNLFGAFGKRHYEGGFDEKMTRKEAALILGVRESAAPQRIKDAHRRILMINHPDKGGSKYMAAKINEAKEILLKGRN